MGNKQDRIAYITSGAFRIASRREWGHLWALNHAVANYKRGQTKEELSKAMLFFRREIEWQSGAGFSNSQRKTKDPFETQMSVYEAAKGLGPIGHIVSTFVQAELQKLAEERQLEDDGFFYSLRMSLNATTFDQYANRSSEILGAAYDLAQKDPVFQEALDRAYGPVLGANTDESAERILANNPEFLAANGVSRLIDANGEIKVNIDDLRDDISTRLKAQAEELSEIRNDIATANQIAERRRATDLEEAANRAVEQAMIAHAAARRKVVAEGLRASTFILTTVLGLQDPKAARQIAAIANAVLDTQSALNNFAENLAKISSTDKFGQAMTSAILTGNLLSVGLTVASALQDTGPTADQVIMEQLATISKQLDDFRNESRERFNRIDATLFAIYETLTHGLKELAARLDNQAAELQEIRQGLSEGLSQLRQVERRLGETLDTLEKRAIRAAWFACIDHERIHGTPLSIADYRRDCIDPIQVALDEATQPAASGEWPAGADWTSFADRIVEGEWAASVNLFRDLATQRVGLQFGAERCANPLRWSFLAHMYVLLAVENPENFSTSPLVMLDRLIESGRTLEQDFAQIMTTKNPEKFLRLVESLSADYLAGVRAVNAALEPIRRQAIEKVGTHRFSYSTMSYIHINSEVSPPRTWENLDAFPLKDVAMQFPRVPVRSPTGEIPLPQVDRSWPPIKGAGAVLNSMPDLCILEDLGLGTIRLEYEILWVEPQYWSHPDNMTETVLALPAVRLLVLLEMADGSVTQVDQLVRTLPTRVVATTNAGAVQRAFGLFEFDFRAFLSASPTVVTQMHVEYNPNSEVFARNPALWEAAERRHNQVLSTIQAETLRGLQAEGSSLAVAVWQLDGVVRALKGLFALSFPNWLEENEGGRSLFFGLPDKPRYYRRNSRVRFGDSLAYIRASEQEQGHYSYDLDDYDGMSLPPNTIIVPHLLSRDVILELLKGAGSEEAGFEARLISLRSLLFTLTFSAQETSKELMFAALSALGAADASEDRIPVVRHQLARLRALRTTHPSALI